VPLQVTLIALALNMIIASTHFRQFASTHCILSILSVVCCAVRTTCSTVRATSVIWKQISQTQRQKRKKKIMMMIVWSLWSRVFSDRVITFQFCAWCLPECTLCRQLLSVRYTLIECTSTCYNQTQHQHYFHTHLKNIFSHRSKIL